MIVWTFILMRKRNLTHKTVSTIQPQKDNLEAMVLLKRRPYNKMSIWRPFRLKKTWTINSKTKYTKTIMVRILLPITRQELGNHLLMLRAKNRIMRRLRFLPTIAPTLWPAMMLSLQMRTLRARLEELLIQRPITMHLRSLLQTPNNSSKLPSITSNPPIGKRISMPWIL